MTKATAFDEIACWDHIRSVLQRLREHRRRAGLLAQAVAEIERVLDEHVVAEPNRRALSALKRALSRIPPGDTEARALAGELYERAQLFYSDDDKYLLHGGAACMYEDMRVELLGKLRSLAGRDVVQAGEQPVQSA